MSKMAQYAAELSEALGHGGNFNDHVQSVYELATAMSIGPDELLSLVRIIKGDRNCGLGQLCADAYRTAARDMYCDDGIKIDDDPAISVLDGQPVGAWVAAWTWVNEGEL